ANLRQDDLLSRVRPLQEAREARLRLVDVHGRRLARLGRARLLGLVWFGPLLPRRHDLAANRLAPRHRHAVGQVALELRRHALAHAELGRVLEVEVQVRLAAAARVAALAHLLAGGHALAGPDPHRALAQGREEGVLAGAVVDDHVVAEGPLVAEPAGDVVRLAVDRRHHDAVAGRQDRLPPAEVVLVRGAVPRVRAAVPHDGEVEREALVARGRVVVLLDGPAAPEHEPLAVEGQAQVGPRLVLEVAGGRRLRGRQRLDQEPDDGALLAQRPLDHHGPAEALEARQPRVGTDARQL